MADTNQGFTPEERHHYEEYCRLAEEARAIYRYWDTQAVPDRIRRPHYARAAKLQKQADDHKRQYIELGAK